MSKNPLRSTAVFAVLVSYLSEPFGVLAQPAYSSSSPLVGAVTSSANGNSKAENRALARLVKRTLRKSSALTTTNITVRAKAGIVTLLGTVPTAAEVSQAVNLAETVPGVTSVNNRLTVDPIQGRADGR